jgi:hypothetical protein
MSSATWNKLETDVINHLIAFMPRRLATVAEKQGCRVPIDERVNGTIENPERMDWWNQRFRNRQSYLITNSSIACRLNRQQHSLGTR